MSNNDAAKDLTLITGCRSETPDLFISSFLLTAMQRQIHYDQS
jgi:hypothetical protein